MLLKFFAAHEVSVIAKRETLIIPMEKMRLTIRYEERYEE